MIIKNDGNYYLGEIVTVVVNNEVIIGKVVTITSEEVWIKEYETNQLKTD